MSHPKWIQKVKIFDVFPKLHEDVKVKTVPSALVTMVASVLMIWLFMSELITFLTASVTEEVGVDVSFGGKLSINVNFTLPGLKCDDFGLDFVDLAGEQTLEVSQTILKQPLYSPDQLGCNLHGYLMTHKVGGEFHIAFGRQAIATGHDSTQHVHRYMIHELHTFNASHIINKLSFGDEFPGAVQALDGVRKIVEKDTARFMYFISIVPTTYHSSSGESIDTNQYSATEHDLPVTIQPGKTFKQPGIYFKYDVSPYRVTYKQHSQSFAHFVTECCAIIGGVFVVAGLISSGLFALKTHLRLDGLLGRSGL